MNIERIKEILKKKLPDSPKCLVQDTGEHNVLKCDIPNHRRYNARICVEEGCFGVAVTPIEQGLIMVSCQGYGHDYSEIISGGRPKQDETIGAGNGGKR